MTPADLIAQAEARHAHHIGVEPPPNRNPRAIVYACQECWTAVLAGEWWLNGSSSCVAGRHVPGDHHRSGAPDSIELCIRDLNGLPCRGVIFRPLADLPYCPKCGSKEPGIGYVRGDVGATD